MVDGIRRYVTKTSGGGGDYVVWHARCGITISETLHVLHRHRGLLDITRLADGYNVQKGRWSVCGRENENVRPLTLHDTKRKFTGNCLDFTECSRRKLLARAPTTYDIGTALSSIIFVGCGLCD